MEYDVKFLQEALDDLEDIILYIAQNNKKAALKMHDIIMEKTELLCKFPKMGKPVPDVKMRKSEFRMLLIVPYIAFYKCIGKTVFIYRILHGATNYPMLYEKISKQSYPT